MIRIPVRTMLGSLGLITLWESTTVIVSLSLTMRQLTLNLHPQHVLLISNGFSELSKSVSRFDTMDIDPLYNIGTCPDVDRSIRKHLFDRVRSFNTWL